LEAFCSSGKVLGRFFHLFALILRSERHAKIVTDHAVRNASGPLPNAQTARPAIVNEPIEIPFRQRQRLAIRTEALSEKLCAPFVVLLLSLTLSR
jgi:hypothetical protein